MADDDYGTPIGNIVRGEVPRTLNRFVRTATNLYPGRLACKDTTENEVKVADGLTPVLGWVGYEQMATDYKKDAFATILEANDEAKILIGGGFDIYASLAAGVEVVTGDFAFSWAAGQIVSGPIINGKPYIRIPIVNTEASPVDTGVDCPSGAIIGLPIIDVVTAVAASTIDVGMGDSGDSQETGYDADGLIDGAPMTATGFVTLNLVDATQANIQTGDLITEVEIKDATGTPVYLGVLKSPGLVCDGTLVSFEYTTNDKAVTGWLLIPVSSPGIIPVGRFPYAVSKSASTQNVWVNSLI